MACVRELLHDGPPRPPPPLALPSSDNNSAGTLYNNNNNKVYSLEASAQRAIHITTRNQNKRTNVSVNTQMYTLM
jgi:hypothetical protein